MELKKIIFFLRHSLYFAVLDSLSAAFGWATVINGAALIYVGNRLGVDITSGQSWPSTLFYAAACFIVGLAIAFTINLFFISPGKAYRLMRPLVLNVSGEMRSPDFVFNNIARGYNSTVVIKNRSHVHILDCTAHIEDLTWEDGRKFNRFVEKFDLPPKSTKYIHVAYWFSRDGQDSDDKMINLSGPVGSGFGGNRFAIPIDETHLKIKIEAPSIEIKHIKCRVWVDRSLRKLMTALESTA
jgi:hypothetical protein